MFFNDFALLFASGNRRKPCFGKAAEWFSPFFSRKMVYHMSYGNIFCNYILFNSIYFYYTAFPAFHATEQ